jgi:uncharacterized protein (DUF2062 family)
LRSRFYELRTEGQGPGREAWAIATGLFIGCTPFFGFHLLITWVFGRLLGLNRLKMYLASNISNPLVAPLLVFSEIQSGAWLRSGSFLPLTLETARLITPWQFGANWLLGSVVVGAAIGAVGGVATYLTLRGGTKDPVFEALARRAADRYAVTSLTAWEFARGKLRGDPVYRDVVLGEWLRRGGSLLDIGCGQGLMLALLAETGRFERLVGIEMRPHRARLARAALGTDAEIIEADARSASLDRFRVVLLFDVLHLMSEADQDALVSTAAEALEPGGVILVREVDAAGGWRFRAVRAGNRLTALFSGVGLQAFTFRSLAGWRECFSRHGLDTAVVPASAGTPFANHLFTLTASAATAPRRQSA